MKISNGDRANILIQALPYIQKYTGQTIVIKYGGNAMINDELKDAVMSDLVLMSIVGIHVVLVHGGGPEINAMLKKIGKESRFVNGLRYTDEETMDIVEMVLCGKVNKSLVQHLELHGGKAIGLCGLDGNMLQAEKLQAEEDIGLVGEIHNVNADPIRDVLGKGYIPVIATVATGKNGETYNINADTAAARIAAELGACKLILMTDIRGLLRDKDDEETLIPAVKAADIPQLQQEGIISGGMIPKMECCADAINRGVRRAHIIDGRIPHSILIEAFTDEGIGTMID